MRLREADAKPGVSEVGGPGRNTGRRRAHIGNYLPVKLDRYKMNQDIHINCFVLLSGFLPFKSTKASSAVESWSARFLRSSYSSRLIQPNLIVQPSNFPRCYDGREEFILFAPPKSRVTLCDSSKSVEAPYLSRLPAVIGRGASPTAVEDICSRLFAPFGIFLYRSREA